MALVTATSYPKLVAADPFSFFKNCFLVKIEPTSQLSFQLFQLRRQLFTVRQNLPQLHEGAHDVNTHRYCTLAIEHVCCHHRAMFGEGRYLMFCPRFKITDCDLES